MSCYYYKCLGRATDRAIGHTSQISENLILNKYLQPDTEQLWITTGRSRHTING
ncbi:MULTISPECIES: hypothetical protein [unclassified Chamaesiphon]|uniref:hypothetical protein n=1 Tax=unclassified Chamaesiphon TaxID=2620921 RepID=UPI00286C70B0|nr:MULTISPECIES: hypothetical protein [unclassified Chamaesiphon]